MKESSVPQLWWRPLLAGLQGVEGNYRETSFLLKKRLAQPPSPIWTGHQDGTPGPIVEDREGGDRGTSQQNVDDRGDRKVGMKTGEISELHVKLLRENVVLPAHGSARAASYDLCVANSCHNTLPGERNCRDRIGGVTPSGYIRLDSTTFKSCHQEFYRHWGGSSRFGLSGRDQSGTFQSLC